MKIISLEGLKGAGKTSIAEELGRRRNIDICEKYMHQHIALSSMLFSLKKRYENKFLNIDEALGTYYYASFFSSLEKAINGGRTAIVLDKGLLSLPATGYYGYLKNKETLPFSKYSRILFETFELAIIHYNSIKADSYFFIIKCNEEERLRRIMSREEIKPSELIAVGRNDIYELIFSQSALLAQARLSRASFHYLFNENLEDKRKAISSIEALVL